MWCVAVARWQYVQVRRSGWEGRGVTGQNLLVSSNSYSLDTLICDQKEKKNGRSPNPGVSVLEIEMRRASVIKSESTRCEVIWIIFIDLFLVKPRKSH